MKNPLQHINKHFESRIRLGIMSVLIVNEWVDFTTLKSWLNTTDGNLSSHLRALENKEYIRVRKDFSDRKPRSSYQLTIAGKEAFSKHIDALEQLIRKTQ